MYGANVRYDAMRKRESMQCKNLYLQEITVDYHYAMKLSVTVELYVRFTFLSWSTSIETIKDRILAFPSGNRRTNANKISNFFAEPTLLKS